MAVKGSGALSIATDIVGEFGGVAPHSLSEYYGGGTYVPAGANPGIATSGQINMGSHYSAVAATVLTISSNVNNYDIGAQAIAAGGDKSTPVILTINAGVTVTTMTTGTGWSNGTTINITNNGSIVGSTGTTDSTTGSQTGTGGKGGSEWNCDPQAAASGSAGSASAEAVNNGGDAFTHSQTSDTYLAVVFDTAGTRTGGSAGTRTALGGGGGGGHGGNYYSGGVFMRGGGGGGAGTPAGGASTGNCGGPGFGYAGSATSGGSGLSGGGNGGSLGQAGGAGGGSFSGNTSPGSGGASSTSNGSAGSALGGNTSQIS